VCATTFSARRDELTIGLGVLRNEERVSSRSRHVMLPYGALRGALHARSQMARSGAPRSLMSRSSTLQPPLFTHVRGMRVACVRLTPCLPPAALHASIDKHHCALLYYQKALAIVTSPSAQASFSPSTGSPLMFPHAEILYNCALCNLAVRHFKSAYECMAVCVATPGVGSRVFAMRPHCWLRMGDALLGIYSDLRDEHAYIHTGEQAIDANLFGWHYYAVTLQGTHPGLGGVKPQPPPAQLGSQTDLDSVAVDPLSRALYCYSRAISLIEGSLGEAEKARHAVYLPACLCLAYVYLEVRMFKEAVQFSAEVLSREKDVGNAQENEVVITSKEELVNRAKLYHSEASFLAKNDK